MLTWNGRVHPAADLFPLIEGEEFDQLVVSVRTKGLVEAGWLLPDGTLLDGRNRNAACDKAGVEMRWRTYDGADPIGLVVSCNIEHRHLTTGQRAMLALAVEKLFAEEARKHAEPRRVANLRQNSPTWADRPAPVPEPPGLTHPARDKAARSAGTSGRAVGRAKRVTERAPDLADKVKAGTLTLDNAEKQVKRREAQEGEQKARETTLTSVTVDASGDMWRMLAGDFRERLLDLPAGCVDLILTDPPYPTESLPLYGDLARIARHVLAPDGICVVLTGQINLHRVFELLGEHLNYGWTYVQPLPGANSRIMGRHIMQSWKPWVAFTRGTWPSGRIDWHPDMLDPSYRSKDQYRWQQDGDPARLLIDSLCPTAGTVCDPFTGTGSYGRAAISMGRRFIGVELDAGRFDQAKEGLDGTQAA